MIFHQHKQVHISGLQEEEWHPDIEATAHITDRAGNLTNVIPYDGSSNVTISKGEQLQITHIGNGKIRKNDSRPLCNVLVVSHIQKKKIIICLLVDKRFSLLL